MTPWTVARQAPLSMEFSRQEYWSGFLCPPTGDPPNLRIDLRSPALWADSLQSEPLGNPHKTNTQTNKNLIFFFFYWRTVALQYHFDFCHTHINMNQPQVYIYPLSPEPPLLSHPIPPPLSCHLFNNVLEWNPKATESQQLQLQKDSNYRKKMVTT